MFEISNEQEGLKTNLEHLYARPLTSQEYFTAKQNLLGFFDVLIKIDQQIMKGAANVTNVA